jgi:hypothetical protein
MKRPHDGSSPSAARRSDEDDAAAALRSGQLEVIQLEGALAVARRAVDDAQTASAPAAAGTPSKEPPTAPCATLTAPRTTIDDTDGGL